MNQALIFILTNIASLLSISSSSFQFAHAFTASPNSPQPKRRCTVANPKKATSIGIPFIPSYSSNFEQQEQVSTQQKSTSSPSLPEGSILLKPEKNEGQEEIAVVFFTGCSISPHQYKGLAQSIQDQSRQNVWVYIPKIPMNMANPFSVKPLMKQSLEVLDKHGFKGKDIYISGHSLGAIFLPKMLKSDHDLAKRVSGIIMLGAFMPRSYNSESFSSSEDDKNKNKNMATLTLNGDLDGLIRPSRVAEAFYHQIILPHNSMIQKKNINDKNVIESSEKIKLHDPVIVVEGMNHFQFIDGKKPMMKNLRDLPSEMSYTEACLALGKTIGEFLDYHHHHDGNQEAKQYLLDQLTKTEEYLNPLISAMELEGSVHLGNGMNRKNGNSIKAGGGKSRVLHDIIDQRNNGRGGSPWVARAHQYLTPAEKVTSAQLKSRDRSNRSWLVNIFSDLSYSLPTIRQVEYENNVIDRKISDDKSKKNSDDDRDLVLHLELGSVSQAVHEEMDIFDTGMFSNAAWELRAKFNSPQSISQALRRRGISIKKNDNESEMENMGGKINSETIKWALDRIPDKVRRRYLEHGKQLIAGCDIEQSNGPSWIWSRLQYENVKGGDGKKYCRVNSHVLKTPVDHPIPLIGGKFYCKLLSPFKAMDWMYTDSLRR